MIHASICAVVLLMASTTASAFSGNNNAPRQQSPTNICDTSVTNDNQSFSTRRAFLASSAIAGLALASPPPEIAHAIGPVKIDLKNPKYKAVKCPPVRTAYVDRSFMPWLRLCSILMYPLLLYLCRTARFPVKKPCRVCKGCASR